jgi:putative ABC transport system permease protein
MKQIAALTSLTLRTLPQRFWMSLAAVVSIALVVAVLLAFLAMGEGFRKTMTGAGSDDVAILLRTGSASEMTSVISREEIPLVEQAPVAARGADAAPQVSPEIYVTVDALKRSNHTKANLPFRGVGPKALDTRPAIRITEGRMLTPGTNEVIVGAGLLREYEGFEVGRTVKLGPSDWVVVGAFQMAGSVFESEAWGDAPLVRSTFNRGTSSQIVRVRLTSPQAIGSLRDYVKSDPRMQLDVRGEKDFYASQGGNVGTLVRIGWVLGVVMAVGALAGAWNSMYASVDARAREIATLRAIGFSGFAAFVAALVESLALAAIGGIVGAIASFALFDGVSASTLGSGFTQVVFTFALTPGTVLTGVVLALIVGLLGGFFPALHAARTPLLAVHQA